MKPIQKRHSSLIAGLLSGGTEEQMRRLQDRMMLADRIAFTLHAKGLSQKALAQKLQKKESEVSEWLSGNRNYTIDTLSDIGNALGVSFFNCTSAGNGVPSNSISTKPGKGKPVVFWANHVRQSIAATQAVADNSEVSILAM